MIDIGETSEPIGPLFHIFQNKLEPGYSIFTKRKYLMELGLTQLIPFSSNSSKSLFCFDYSEDKLNPTVVFFDRDYELNDPNAFTKVASSFTEFINGFYED